MVGKPTPLQFQCLSLPPSLLFSKLNHGYFSTSLTTSFPLASTFHFHSPHSKPNIHLQQPPPNTTNPTLTHSYHHHSTTHLRRKVHTHTHTFLERQHFLERPHVRIILLLCWFLRTWRIPRSSSCTRNCNSMDLLGERESQESLVLRLDR